MAVYTTIDDAGSFNNSVLYTGTGSSNAIADVGFQPDFTWIKNRDTTDFHVLTDAVRGVTKYLQSDANSIEVTNVESLKTFDSDGFTVGTMNEVNTNTEAFVSWNWKGGTTTGITTDGSTTITPDAYSFNQTSGVSILKYEGNNTNDQKVAHGLGAAPECMIIKDVEDAYSWCVYHKGVDATAPEDYVMRLDTTAARVNINTMWNDTAPDSVNFTLGDNSDPNPASKDCVAYCFRSIQGFSKISSYVGNGNANGTFVNTGFRPAWIMAKSSDNADNWMMFDDKRVGYNVNNYFILANNNIAETTSGYVDILSNGFKFRSTDGSINTAAGDYIYMAFAESPFVNAEGVPNNAR